MNLLEGGNVFKDATGKPLTQRISSADVPGTIKWLEKLTGLDLTGKEKDKDGVPTRWLGSTGRRDTSGDLDIALDANIVSKEQLNTFLTQWATKNNLDPAQFVKKAGELHFRTPINGYPKQGFVQTDFNFYPDPKALTWGTFYMSGSSANYKGMARNVLLSSLAKQQGLKIGGNGVVSRTTNKLIPNGQDPDLAAQMVLGPGKKRNDLATVEAIYANLARDPERDAKLADFREYLASEGLAEPTLKEENEVNFMARLRDRIVNQGMYTLIEAAAPAVSGGHAKGIEHLEDLVFRKGSRGIAEALAIAEHAVQDTKSTVSVKWDGCVHPDLLITTEHGKMPISIAIEKVNSGDYLQVLGHDLYLNVDVMVPIFLASNNIGSKDWVEVELDNGDKLKVTADHEIYTTNRGWIQAQNLNSNDDIKESNICDGSHP